MGVTLEMYQIALCDDIKSELEKIEILLEKYEEKNQSLKHHSYLMNHHFCGYNLRTCIKIRYLLP